MLFKYFENITENQKAFFDYMGRYPYSKIL
jgi:hypothetical protein